MMIRDDDDCKAWEMGEVQIAISENRLYIIDKESLNVSIPIDGVVFHAGSKNDLLKAIKSLSNVNEVSVLADFATIAEAIRA